jgi:Polyketide cyclase / dehydrase and lipid transport
MTSLRVERALPCTAGRAWELLRDVGAPQRAFPGMLTDARLTGDTRQVTFADGTQVEEAIVGVDDDRRRIAYAVVGGRFRCHASSIEVAADGHTSTLRWWTDVLPDEAAPRITQLMEAGADAFVRAVSEG